ncbi:siderophore-interacting protein [Jatrophihabitans sp.]|uniref:siderophore-interacting protein n=1 Tax=Jatrophihabitans sp. TaxID=1932789 RepID=UPI0030C70C7A|nr:siderophore-interacting protein [Jatrophihabitans sp.]
MTAPTRTPRPPRPLAVLAVQSSEWLTEHIVRLTVGGEGFAAFQTNDYTDKYVKIRFVDAEGHAVTRTYTVRRVDTAARTLTIDFVVHGGEGLAGPWAAAAEPGDVVSLSGAGGGYAPDPRHDWHLFVGDESALPAIGAALDALPRDSRGIAYLEVPAEAHRVELNAPEGVELVWLHGHEPGAAPQALADAISAGSWLPGSVGVFAHGERESMKAVRAALRAREVGSLSLSGYWAYGRTEDRFQAEKREPIGQIEP